jgi:hypothetical protein
LRWRAGSDLHMPLMVSWRVTPKLYTSHLVDKMLSNIYSGGMYPLND